MPTVTKKPKGRPKKTNRYGLSAEFVAQMEREFRRILPRAGSDKEQAELLRIARRGFGLRN